MKNNSYRSFLRNYFLASFFFDFIFAYAIYNLLFSVRGLSVFQISLLLSGWALATLLLEIPTGALADSWNRKKMLVLAPLFKAVCFIIWFLAGGNFYLYALGFLFWAIGSSFISGTSESLLFDSLSYFNLKAEYTRILSRKKFYFHLALAISMLLGGILAHFQLEWAIIFSVVPLIASSFFASLIKEVPQTKSTEEIHYLQYLKIAYQEIRSNKTLLFLFIYLFGISVFADLEELDQLYYRLVNLPIFAFGIVGFFWSALNAFASFNAYKLKGSRRIFYVLPFLSGIFLLFVARFPIVPIIGLLLLSYSITTPLRILAESQIQYQIKSMSRATITSIGAFLVNLFGIILMPLYGLISKIWNLQAVYYSTAIFLFIFSLWASTPKVKQKFGGIIKS